MKTSLLSHRMPYQRLGDQTSIWEEDDESETESPRKNLFTSSPKQPSSEESKRSSKDSAISSITPTELKFSSPESDINSKTLNARQSVSVPGSRQCSDPVSIPNTPIQSYLSWETNERQLSKATKSKSSITNPPGDRIRRRSTIHVAAVQCICFGNRGSQPGTRNDYSELYTNLRQEAIQEVQTVRNHVQESFQEEFQQERTTTEATTTTTTEGGHSRDD